MEKAKYLVTYLCADCGVDFARTELSLPICFYCRSNGPHKIIKRETLTAEAMVKRMKFVSERAISGLVKAFAPAEEDK
jgi:hypothetical protein